MNNRSRITHCIFREIYKKRLLRIDEAVALVAPPVLGCNQPEADSYANLNKRYIWKRLIQRIDEENDKGLHPTFTVIDRNRYEFAWFPKLRPSDDSSLKRKKLRLAHRGKILNYLDTINYREYEAVGCVICSLAGATRVRLTDPGNEFGIDFLAVLPAYGNGHLFPHAHKQIRLVGQAKKRTSPIKREKIDLLAGTLDDIRRRNREIFEKVLPAWFVSAKGLLVGCMLAHSGAQSGAHDRAHEHGIILADSRDVAEMVALNRNWDITNGTDAAIRFFKREIQTILQEYKQSANEN
jgi:hypothetical protein